MSKAGEIAAAALVEVAKNIRPGVSLILLDKIAEEKILLLGAEPSFKKVPGYRYSTCLTPNNLVVHGVPGDYVLAEGDILGVDIGAYYQGFHSDVAETFPVGKIDEDKKNFLATGKKALQEAISQIKIGNQIGDISSTIQAMVEEAGYSVVKELTGHGVGRDLHEDPPVPGWGKKATGEPIKEGLVLAIEVIYNQGKQSIKLLPDGWSLATSDGSLSGLFERTVAATRKGPLVLTRTGRLG